MKNKIGNVLFYSLSLALILVLLGQVGLLPLRLLYIRTGSMSPAINPGDAVLVDFREISLVHPGDIILFYLGDEPVVHRVIKIENDLIITQGDANNAPDQNPVRQVSGKVILTIPKLGYLFDIVQRRLNIGND